MKLERFERAWAQESRLFRKESGLAVILIAVAGTTLLVIWAGLLLRSGATTLARSTKPR